MVAPVAVIVTRTALLATRHGSIRPAVAAIVDERGCSVADILATDADENGRYNLPPGLVERLAERVSETDAEVVVVDGLFHSGQRYDLADALPPVDVLDRRELYYESLANGGNEAAGIARDLRARQLERRAAKRAQRDGSTASPSGESGAVKELSDACDRLTAELEACQTRRRRQVETSYEDVDGHAVVVGPVDGATTEVWAALTETAVERAVLRPATPRTTILTLGPQEVAITDTPGLVAGQPAWYTEVIPRTMAAIRRADVLFVARSDDEQSLDIEDTGFDGTVLRTRVPPEGDEQSWREQLRGELQQALPTVRLDISLPYGAESLLSRLYDETSVESVEYGEEIEAKVVVSARRADSIERAVEQAGGTVDQSE